MAGYRIISSDDHVFEPQDMWTGRVEPKFGDRAPRIVREESGVDWWYCDGLRVVSVEPATQAGVRFVEPEKLKIDRDTFEDVRPGAYVPEEHVKDMDIDGIDVSIVYPTVGLTLFRLPDSELLTALFKTYNDWIAEFCKPFPNRLKGIAMLNVDDIQDGINELERCAKLGFAGAMITSYPPEEKLYDLPEYEPLWAAAQDLEVPISLHVSTNRMSPGREHLDFLFASPAFMSNIDHWARMSIAQMIFSGVFERYPKLRVVAVEHELSWVPHFLERIDFTYTQRQVEFAPYRFKEDMLPSDYFHQNVTLSFQEDALGIKLREVIGVDKLLWGADYPHPESTFPKSREILEQMLVECSEEEKAKIVGGNASRIYHLD